MDQATVKPKSRSFQMLQWEHWPLLIIIGLSLWFYLWGVQRSLPYTPEVDELVFVKPAVNMAATGDLNPKWFGHPGSTVIYSLAVVYHSWNVIFYNGDFFHSNPETEMRFLNSPSEFYLLGRILSITFGVLGIFMTYKLGRRVAGKRVGLIGAWLLLVSPFIISHTRYVRSDSASIFFSVLSLWLCLKLYEKPSAKNQALAGIGIGLSIATKYYLATIIPVLLGIDALILKKQDLEPNKSRRKWLEIGVGFIAIGVSFALSVPYFFLDFATARDSLLVMGHSTHLGHDGLSYFGNLAWYLQTAIPKVVFWPQLLLIVVGGTLALFQRKVKLLFLLGYAVMFLLVLSRHPLHWERWLLPIFPILALFAAYGLDSILKLLNERQKLSAGGKVSLALGAIILISAWPTYKAALLGIRHARPSTRILAREWIMENLPADSRIAQESYTALLSGTGFSVSAFNALPNNGRTLNDYHQDGYDYVVVSSNMYDRYFAEPNRYSDEVTFYQTLFETTRLSQQFESSDIQTGPTIRIYALDVP